MLEVGMMDPMIRIGGAAILLSLYCGSCEAQIVEPVTRSRCSLGSHEVANLNAVDPRRAYRCKSDIDGYLDEEGAGHLSSLEAK
jgi:hypothetical protein